MMKRWSSTSFDFIPITARSFPPLQRGGQGGWAGRNQDLCQAAVSGNSAGSSGPEPCTRRPVPPGPPPLTPPLQGGERKRRARLTAQQKPVWTGAHNTTVKANFSSLQGSGGGPCGTESVLREFGASGPRRIAAAVRGAASAPPTLPDPKTTTPPFLPSDRGGEFEMGGKGASIAPVREAGAREGPVRALRNRNPLQRPQPEQSKGADDSR